MDPKHWKGGKAPVKAAINLPTPPSSDPPLPTHLAPSPLTAPLIIAPLGSPSSMMMSQPDAAWPSWFRDAHTLLSSQSLGMVFMALIEQFVQLEKHTAFAPGTHSGGFKLDNRLPEVHYWISCRQVTEPKISAVKDFEASWWKWWKGLQPDWRVVLEVEGILDSAHQPTLMGNEDWLAVDKYGRNAFFFVMVTLLWWGAAVPGPANGDAHWMAAVRDVGNGVIPVEFQRNRTGIKQKVID
ncbi:uncharacterized protein LACBIDRAFT_335124 [Laccaria bicolor S238N-H82]|uniref:Predicted protein n=1 Tax=Laccaria bicolor (strain S238N-H82 / ATCC MYA-4686) TaxID=486041 RepID=B0E1F7_LACBS|nr:uncharacterized protein LACBIDRAFT_335124 [Laccaria bicolor S238N-H82]EDQ99300.1 predicted protein [Laccaria bicolor S238N-H82]|eukprot:XP_001890020.1 predicted protein [Laccaria bicolor S238N-H82]